MDGDTSIIDHRIDNSSSSPPSIGSFIYHDNEKILKHQRNLAENNAMIL